MVGTYVLSAGFYDAYYNRARKVRRPHQARLRAGLRGGHRRDPDARHPFGGLRIGEMANADPVQMYLNDVFTVTVNLAGPARLSVPAGLDRQGLPLGLQLIGRPWEEGDF
jgi:aspartyl-tRNA(Asn)/glutamyl-tRNA(Gln) amidotransferase subunit A